MVNPGAQHSIQVSMLVAGTEFLEPLSPTFQAAGTGAEERHRQGGAPRSSVGVALGRLTIAPSGQPLKPFCVPVF